MEEEQVDYEYGFASHVLAQRQSERTGTKGGCMKKQQESLWPVAAPRPVRPLVIG